MKARVEILLGYEVEEDQFESSLDYAKRKLNFQDVLYGQDNRASEKYVAKVVSEIYESQFFTSFTNKLSTEVLI